MAASDSCCEILDPRIRRTRQLLQQALDKLLETKEFDKISVQDIAEQATVNRATFYDHYADKFALLECTVAARFHELLDARGVQFDGSCAGALRGIILGVCDYLAGSPGMNCERQRQMEPHRESAIIAVVRQMMLQGLKQHAWSGAIPQEMIAATVSWAIFGAAKEWVRTPNRPPSEEMVETVAALVSPIFASLQALKPHSTEVRAN
jgi:AcrR family transcriptional regulator